MIVVDADRTGVIECTDLNGGSQEFDTALGKVQFADDLREQRRAGGQGRAAKARMKFFGSRGPADQIAAFKHQRL